jgi:hypothetical protein
MELIGALASTSALRMASSSPVHGLPLVVAFPPLPGIFVGCLSGAMFGVYVFKLIVETDFGSSGVVSKVRTKRSILVNGKALD